MQDTKEDICLEELQMKKKITPPSKWQFCAVIPFAVLYMLFIVLGDLEKAEQLGVLRNIVRILLLFSACYIVLLLFCFLISQRGALLSCLPETLRPGEQQARPGRWYIFTLFFLICFFCYLPYYLMYYPTWFNNDAVWQMEQILGLVPRSNHHPYFHTMIIQFFFEIGYRLSGNYTDAIGFYTFWQVVIMALLYAFILHWLYKRGTRMFWLFIALLFYAALPVNGMQALCMGKDAFFVAALFFFTCTTVETACHAELMTGRRRALRYLAWSAAGFLVCVLRSNGIFIFVGTIVILSVYDWQKKRSGKKVPYGKKVSGKYGCAAAVLLCYLIYHGPVLAALHVELPDTIESLTMPAQHLVCAYLKGGELTEEEIGMIDRVVPTEKVGEAYNPYLFDPVKALIREEGNQQAIEENKWEYFKLWLRVGLRNPLQYVVAEVRQTMGYWAYRVRDPLYLYGDYFMVDNSLGVETRRKLFSYDDSLAMGNYLQRFQEFYNRVWSLGLNTWLMFFALAFAVYEKRNVMPFVPYLILFLTLLLAAPVYNEFRYIYGLFIALPVLFSYSFGQTESEALPPEGETSKSAAGGNTAGGEKA